MTAAPSHTMIKTISNNKVRSSAWVLDDKILKCEIESDLRCKNQAEEERSPEVPVADLFSLLFVVCVSKRIDDDVELIPDTLQVSFLSNCQTLS